MLRYFFILLFLQSCFAPSQNFQESSEAFSLANPAVENLKNYTDDEVLVAVLDTGIDYSHPRLHSRLRNIGSAGQQIMGLDLIANDYFPYYAVIEPTSMQEISDKLQSKEHGTHVSSLATLGGHWRRNGQSFDFNSQIALLPIRVIPLTPELAPKKLPHSVSNFFMKPVYTMGYSFINSLKDAFAFMQDLPVKVINMSLGITLGQLPDDAEELLIQKYKLEVEPYIKKSKALIVLAAGNDGLRIDQESSHLANIIRTPNMIVVGALEKDESLTDFSNYGPLVDVYINGRDINSLLPGGRGLLSGTSMAAPLIANLAAKLLVINPNLKTQDLKTILLSTCDTKSVEGKEICVANFSKAMELAFNY